jgi:hypothetical protein
MTQNVFVHTMYGESHFTLGTLQVTNVGGIVYYIIFEDMSKVLVRNGPLTKGLEPYPSYFFLFLLELGPLQADKAKIRFKGSTLSAFKCN